MPLELIRLNDLNVHVRYSNGKGGLSFRQYIYRHKDRDKAPSTHTDITLWIISDDDYVALDTDKVMRQMAEHEKEDKRVISVRLADDGLVGDKIPIADECVIASKLGSKVKPAKNIAGLGQLIQIAQGYVTSESKSRCFFGDLDLAPLESYRMSYIKIYKIKNDLSKKPRMAL